MRHKPIVYLSTSEDMSQVADKSAKLMVGSSVYMPGRPWADYLSLYRKVYVTNGRRVLRDDGYLVVIQTDAYTDGQVFPRNVLLPPAILEGGYKLIDVKVWRRQKSNFFQPPFSMAWVFAAKDAGRGPLMKFPAYRQAIWEYPTTTGGRLNGWPSGLCDMLVETFTKPGDLIIDPFCGTGPLLASACAAGRQSIGYEIDASLESAIRAKIEAACQTSA